MRQGDRIREIEWWPAADRRYLPLLVVTDDPAAVALCLDQVGPAVRGEHDCVTLVRTGALLDPEVADHLPPVGEFLQASEDLALRVVDGLARELHPCHALAPLAL